MLRCAPFAPPRSSPISRSIGSPRGKSAYGVALTALGRRLAEDADFLTRGMLDVSQRGVTKLVVLDRETFEQWKADRERLQALEIKLLVDAGEEAFRGGKYVTHEQLGRKLARRGPRRSRAK